MIFNYGTADLTESGDTAAGDVNVPITVIFISISVLFFSEIIFKINFLQHKCVFSEYLFQDLFVLDLFKISYSLTNELITYHY